MLPTALRYPVALPRRRDPTSVETGRGTNQMPERRKVDVTLANSRYQPSKAELEEAIEFPEGTTPEDLARAVTQDVNIRWTDQPE